MTPTSPLTSIITTRLSSFLGPNHGMSSHRTADLPESRTVETLRTGRSSFSMPQPGCLLQFQESGRLLVPDAFPSSLSAWETINRVVCIPPTSACHIPKSISICRNKDLASRHLLLQLLASYTLLYLSSDLDSRFWEASSKIT